MRTLKLIWTDGKPFKRRARMYVGALDVRVEYIDATHRINVFYDSPDDAKHAVDEFANGKRAIDMRYLRGDVPREA